MNWFIQALKKTFTYRGRARRAEFGWFNLISFLISLALIIVPAVVFDLGGNLLAATYQSEAINIITNAGTLIFELAYSLFSLVTTLAHFSLSARRLHDLGFSGWWQLAVYLGLPIIVFLSFIIIDINEANPSIIPGLIAPLVLLMYAIYLGVLLFMDGQRFTNKYGKDPKAEPQTEPVEQTSISVLVDKP